jgi:hypothetical protein
VLGEIGWFAFLYPLVPRSWLAALVEFALPVALAAYVYLIVRALLWLGGRPLSAVTGRLIGILLAVSVGVFAFLLVYVAQSILPSGFGRGLATSWL